MDEKLCSKCGESKAPVEFGNNRRTKDGKQAWCKLCMREYNDSYSKTDRRKEYFKKYFKSDHGYNKHLQRQFGITVEVYNDMLARQGHVCAICNQPCRSGRRLAVDHSHRTGEVRGLLCLDCNTAIGKLQDSSVIAYQAARYLERSGA